MITDKIKNYTIIGLIILISILGYLYTTHLTNSKNALIQEQNLTKALTDSVHTYKNANGELVNEKLTIQATTKELSDKNLHLTSLQKDLVDKVNELNKHNQVIDAALIKMDIKLSGLIDSTPTAETDSTVEFSEKTDSISYDLLIGNVKALENKIPFLKFNKFSLPNVQTVEFHWKNKDKKEGYPISFTVTNSNPLYKVYDIESYAIPELEKSTIKPTFWQKLGKFSKKTGGRVLLVGVGVVIGALLVK